MSKSKIEKITFRQMFLFARLDHGRIVSLWKVMMYRLGRDVKIGPWHITNQ